MKISFQGSNNAKDISTVEKNTGMKLTRGEVFKGKSNNHKYSVGQKCKLFGLKTCPEWNGEIIEITSIREDGPYGKAYYFKTTNTLITKQFNWIYEYMLEL